MRHLSISVRWSMYRGRGAGRWAKSSSGACVLPYRRPACARTAARRDEPEGTRSLPCWPCRAAAVAAAMWTGMVETLRAPPILGQRTSPRLLRPPRVGGMVVSGACPPPTWWPVAVVVAAPAGGSAVAATHGCSGPLKCSSKLLGATCGVALPGGAVGGGGGVLPRGTVGGGFWGEDSASVAPAVAGRMRGSALGRRAPPPPRVGYGSTHPWPPRRVRPVAAATRPGRRLGSEVQPVRGRHTTAIPSVPPTPRPAAPCPLDRWRRTTTKGSGCPDGAPHR